MGYLEQVAWRPRTRFARRHKGINGVFIAVILALALVVVGINPALAGAQMKNGVYVVGNDRGGFLKDRLIELSNLRKSGRRVEIRGGICFSTCTMLLGLPKTCISPDTIFGFHGPSRSGHRLDAEQFDHFSRVIAYYYPAPLQTWYMEKGRKRIHGLHRIRGSEIVRMGISEC